MTQQDPYTRLKAICTRACHEREACAEGYRQMLASENVSQMMATWRTNWQDVTESKFADIILAELPTIYPDIKQEMMQAGIYMNFCPEDAKSFVRVLVCDSTTPVHIYGDAQAYVLGTARVVAHDHAHVVNVRSDSASVTLLDYSVGTILKGDAVAMNRSTLNCACRALLNGSVTCHATGGTVTASGYCRIEATGDTIVYARNGQSIYLEGNAQLKPITDNEQ